MQKTKYDLDPSNRFVSFRQTLDGKFKIDRNNDLSYHVISPLTKGDNIPNQLKLSGEWTITKDHKLSFVLDRTAKDAFGERITLQGEILDVGKDSLLFAVTTARKNGAISTYTLNLEGFWQADENNRLTFQVKREKGRTDVLTFNGAWKLGDNNQIIYEYEKADLIRKKRRTQTLLFKGHWDIAGKGRLSYVMSADTNSVFEFSASAGIFKEDFIAYEVGISVENRRKDTTNKIKLYGKWNIKKDVGLIFQVEYENGVRKPIVFGSKIELSRKIGSDAEAFLRLLASNEELGIFAGAAGRW